MEQTAIPLGDAMNLCNNANNNNFMNNPFFYLIWLAYMGGNGFGGFGNNGVNMATIEAAKADVIQNTQAVTDSQTLSQQIRGIANGLSEGFSSTTFALNNAMKDNTFNLSNAIGNVGTNMQMGFCQTNHNIDNLKYENAKNTGEIVTNATANTQKILDKLCCMEGNAKNEIINELRQKLSESQLAYSQQAQNAYLISQLKTTA